MAVVAYMDTKEYFKDDPNYNTLLFVSNNSNSFFQAGCLFAWAWTLIRLYKDFKGTEKLLPKKRVFILHGVLLTLFLLLDALG